MGNEQCHTYVTLSSRIAVSHVCDTW